MTFARRILLAVTGLSPQVVTETLYALGVTPPPGQPRFLPTEVHLLTTDSGARLARTALLHPDGGQFPALLADYPQLGAPRFDDASIHVIRDATGQPLADIRTPEENACAADSITALVNRLTRDPDSQLHVSIAGGRKTMGFYLGYAFSLFARPQDELSHVLVSSPFENHPEFFFPPARPRRLASRDGRHLDTADARITLARIPVVRLRHGQPQALLDGQASFGDTVAAIQRSLEPPSLHVDLITRKVSCGGVEVNLPPAQLAWLAWWVLVGQQGLGPQGWRDADLRVFLELYRRVVSIDAVAYENACERVQSGMENDADRKAFFEESNAKLEAALKRQLDLGATPYLLVRHGKRPHTRRALALAPSAMTLVR